MKPKFHHIMLTLLYVYTLNLSGTGYYKSLQYKSQADDEKHMYLSHHVLVFPVYCIMDVPCLSLKIYLIMIHLT